METKRPRGRPSKWTQALEDEICERVADGEPLRKICRDDHMPTWVSVYRWREAKPSFSLHLSRARLIGFDAIAEDCLLIANETEEGVEIEESPRGTTTKTKDMTSHRELKIATRLMLLAKWYPEKFGDAQKLEVTGKDGAPLAAVPSFADMYGKKKNTKLKVN